MSCIVCQHAKIQAIDAAIASGRLVGVVATQFRVKKADLIKHLEHAPTQAMSGDRLAHIGATIGEMPERMRPVLASPLMVTANPLSQFKRAIADAKQAYELARDDEAMRYRMASILQEAFASDDMGL